MKIKTGLAIGMMAVNEQSGKTKSANSVRYPNEQAHHCWQAVCAANESIPRVQPFCDSPSVYARVGSTIHSGTANAAVAFLGLSPGYVGLAQADVLALKLPPGTYPLVIQ